MGKRREIGNGDAGRPTESDEAGNAGRSIRASRLAFASALTALMLGTFVSFGGLSYAGTATTNAVNTITKVATGHKVVVRNSSASNQYAKPKKKHKSAATMGTSHGSTGTPSQQGTLPFTGLSLAGTTLVSGLLLLLGIMLRRRERRSS